MKYGMLVVMMTALGASPAFALKITNLDNVPHRVVFESAGNRQVESLAPNETVRINAQPDGMLSLLAANSPKPSKGTLHADGLLSGIVGAVRSENIPTNDGDEFTIWPGGRLLLQKHSTNDGNGSIF